MSDLRDTLNKHLRTATPQVNIINYFLMTGVQYEATWLEPVVAADAKKYVRIQTDPIKWTILNARLLAMDQEKGFYRAYSTFTGGAAIAPIPIRNGRSDSTIMSGQIAETFSAPATIDPDSISALIPLFGIPGAGASASAAGTTFADTAIRVVEPGATLLLEFENNSTNACYFQVDLKWAEVGPQSIPLILNL